MVKRLEVEGLTPEVLTRLYEQDGLTETEIGQRFGIGQVQVGRFRKRWGIATRTKADRIMADLPPLTDVQQQLLVGSLLGDGSLGMTSEGSAHYTEGHCTKQEGYLRWKADLLGPLVSSVFPTTKRVAGKEFHGWRFCTKSCPLLWPLYDAFYPAPDRKRVFPADLPARMTPFVLAIWYMDDGSLLPDGSPRISFGGGPVSLRRALVALRALGLSPKVYGEGTRQAIHFPKQTVEFAGLVGPHLHETLQYKLPRVPLGDRRLGDQNARKLGLDRAQDLYTGGVSVQAIAALHGVGESTVKRRLTQAGTAMRASGPRKDSLQTDNVPVLLDSIAQRASNWANIPKAAQDGLVAAALSLLRAIPFPLPDPPVSTNAQEALQDVSEALTADGLLTKRRGGIALCTALFPNRYQARSRGVLSAYEAWHLDSHLSKAIAFQLKVGDPIQPHRVLRAVTMACRTPSVFRPVVAGTLYRTYCPAGGRVWDPCAGYGGRVLGALAAGVQYVGTDVDTATIEGNQRLADLLGRREDVTLHVCPAQDFDPPSVDMVFTSPPYFNREIYSDGVAQSWKLGDFSAWVRGFLAPVIVRAHRALPVGGPLILNVSDIRDRGRVVPLVQATIDTALANGFDHEATLQMPLAGLNRTKPFEPVLVFRRR